MKKILYILFICITPVIAQNDSLFEKGNSAYNQGDYQTAINQYEQILENGQESAELYFNLANAHYKANDVAPSVYFYEKALQLDPKDGDIQNNLKFAQNMVLDDIEPVERTGLARIWNNAVSILSYNQWAWLAVGLSFFFAASFLLYYFNRKSGLKRTFFTISVVVIAIAVLCVGLAFQQKSIYTDNQFAVIFSDAAGVRSEPTLRGDESYTLHAGTKVEVLERYQDWVKFELVNGNEGWMQEKDLRFL